MRTIRVGRDLSNDIVLNDDAVSRNHCQFIMDDNGNISVIDSSTNGTSVNGILINRSVQTPLKSGDVVRIGGITLDWQNYFNYRTEADVRGVGNGYGGNYPPSMKPNNYLALAILATIFCCLPFGIVSIVYAAKVDGLWRAHDYEGSQSAAKNARIWFWVAFAVGIVSIIISSIYYFAALAYL